MKRDWRIIREMALSVRDFVAATYNQQQEAFWNLVNAPDAWEHFGLMMSDGIVEGHCPSDAMMNGLTTKGQDFVGLAQNPAVFNAAMARLDRAGVGGSLDLLLLVMLDEAGKFLEETDAPK